MAQGVFVSQNKGMVNSARCPLKQLAKADELLTAYQLN